MKTSPDLPASRYSVTDNELPIFPPLPRDSYSPHPTQHLTTHVSTASSTAIVLNDAIHLAWALVLIDQANSTESVYGIAYHGRRTDTGEQAILPFRLQINPQDTVADALAAAAAQRLHLRQWEHLGLRRFSTRSPENVRLCQFRNLLVIQDGEAGTGGMDEVAYSDGYALSVFCRIQEDQVDIQARFDPVVIVQDQMRLMLIQFADVLRMCLLGSAQVVNDLQRIGPEGFDLVRQWNLEWEVEEQPVTVYELIERQLKGSADDAVAAWDGNLSYRELDRLSSCIAVQLALNDAVKPGAFIGIFMSKSRMAVASMVAITRAGAAFVFLPPMLPIPRLRVICEKTSVDLVLSDQSHLAQASELGPRVQVVPSDPLSAGPAPNTTWTPPVALPSHPLYAIYTSGSTGEPKGVVVDRGSVGPGVRQFIDRLRLGPGVRVLQSVSYAFIVSIMEQLMALASGACICVPSEDQLQNNPEAAICQLNATWAMMTPSVARTLSPSSVTSLKSLIFVGEPVNQSDLDQWSKSATLYSVYGQSETASSLLIQDLSGTSASASRCGLGQTTTGACWIVRPDDHTRLTPLGVEGELMIESTALERRYLNNADESVRTFVERPPWLQELRSPGSEARCLLTGDIVRYIDTSGTIRFVGRKGTGAKIRGQRVELGEVEYHLRARFSGASHVIVEVIKPAGRAEEQPMLVGFVAGLSKTTEGHTDIVAPSTRKLRSQVRLAIAELRNLLPSFMVPSAILSLAAVPTTATGKIHRKALRERMALLTVAEILAYNREDRVAYRPPSDRREQLLQSLCEELLCLSPATLSLDENFFEAGGDSLTARQLVTSAHLQGMALTVADIFEAPKLSDLAWRMKHLKQKHDGAVDVPDPFEALRKDFLQTVPGFLHEVIEDVYPTHDLGRRTIHEQRVDYYPFVIKGPLDRRQLRSACEAFVQRTPVMRSVFVPFHRHMLQVMLRAINSPYREITVPNREAEAEGENKHEDKEEDAITWTRSFITQDQKSSALLSFDRPVIRFFLICKSPQDHVLLLRLPHAFYDGGCLQQIGDLLSSAYNGHPLRGGPTFGDYMRACARLHTPEAFHYWTDLLRGAEITRLPRTRQELNKGGQTMCIYAGECAARTPPAGLTLATAIKAAWAWTLHRETGKNDILFGQVSSMRGIDDLPGASEVVGFCLNTTAVRVELTAVQTWTVRKLLDAIHTQHVRGLRYETLNWSEVVEAASGTWTWTSDRDTAGTPTAATRNDFDSVVLHENFGSLPSLRLGEATGAMADPVFSSPLGEQLLLATFPGEGRLAVLLVAREGAFEKGYGEALVEGFGRRLTGFLDFPERRLLDFE
ncbi:hypothetical protein BJX61DRAFT_542694 [Aspergillus egyptiacus]|nr:hypothetical protein BJX61DRAFT_542694 [Aspergillus egyptiacus]